MYGLGVAGHRYGFSRHESCILAGEDYSFFSMPQNYRPPEMGLVRYAHTEEVVVWGIFILIVIAFLARSHRCFSSRQLSCSGVLSAIVMVLLQPIMLSYL
jgi:hypothetical protein